MVQYNVGSHRDRAGTVGGTHDVRSGIALTRQVEGTRGETWEDLD